MAYSKHAERKELDRYETLIQVLARGEYSLKDKPRLLADVRRFCIDNPETAAPFESARDIDLALRNLIGTGAVLAEEDTGLLKLV